MASKSTPSFWWMKKSKTDSNIAEAKTPVIEGDISTSLAEFLEKEGVAEELSSEDRGDVDIPSIIEEINRIAAQSPLGPFEDGSGDRSVEDLMKEVERIYLESSRSFEQLSQHSATSHNVTDHLNSNSQSPVFGDELKSNVSSANSENTPKSLNKGLIGHGDTDTEEYSDDFSENKSESNPSNEGVQKVHHSSLESFGTPNEENKLPIINNAQEVLIKQDEKSPIEIQESPAKIQEKVPQPTLEKLELNTNVIVNNDINHVDSAIHLSDRIQQISLSSEMEAKNKEVQFFKEEALKKDNVIEHLIEENKIMKSDLKELQVFFVNEENWILN